MNFLLRRKRRQDKRLRVLRKMAVMRSAKARKRLARPIIEEEPKMVRTFPLEIGIRDTITGEDGWVPLKSARFARRLATVMLNFYMPRFPEKHLGTIRETE